jgi:hypothetical protein
MAQRLNEGPSGNIDKLYSQIQKAASAIEKAQSAVLDAADEMDAILVESQAIGGKIAEIVPSHIKVHIAKLTEIADTQLGPIAKGDSQSSLDKLEELIGSIPYREIRPPTAQDRRQGISLQPNVSQGPQSAIQEQASLEEFYRRGLREEAEGYEYDDGSLSFDKLKESNIFGTKLEDDMMSSVNMKLAKPISVAQVRERTRVAADDVMFEDQEELEESGPLDFSRIRAFGGSDGIPMKFSALREGGTMVDNT